MDFIDLVRRVQNMKLYTTLTEIHDILRAEGIEEDMIFFAFMATEVGDSL